MYTNKRHQEILSAMLKVHTEDMEALRKELQEAKNLGSILHKLSDKVNNLYITGASSISRADSPQKLPDDVARYVDDYFWGKVIKQEAIPVTILDELGKATYWVTKKPTKNKYHLIQK